MLPSFCTYDFIALKLKKKFNYRTNDGDKIDIKYYVEYSDSDLICHISDIY